MEVRRIGIWLKNNHLIQVDWGKALVTPTPEILRCRTRAGVETLEQKKEGGGGVCVEK